MMMEAIGGVSARCFNSVSGGHGPGIDLNSSNNIRSPTVAGLRRKPVPCFRRSPSLVSGASRWDYFLERDHLDYYYNYSSGVGVGGGGGGGRGRCGNMMICCGKGKVEGKGKMKELKEKKKKKKKVMMKNLLENMIQKQIVQGFDDDDSQISSEMAAAGFSPDQADLDPINPLPNQAKAAQMISDAAEQLLQQLQQIREEEKDSEMMMMSSESSSSSSSSESSDSDSECGEVVTDMRRQKNSCIPVALESKKPLEAPPPEAALPPLSVPEIASIAARHEPPELPQSACNVDQQDENIFSPVALETARLVSHSTKRVEVCMGGKCKKSGAMALLGEFQRMLGTENAAVSGCKCMGKCRYGPNVRIVDEPYTNSLCIGVGLTDVDAIVANYIASSSEFSLNAA